MATTATFNSDSAFNTYEAKNVGSSYANITQSTKEQFGDLENNNNAARNVWLDLLSEVREKKSASRYAKRNVVLLGDYGSGKSGLITSLKHGGSIVAGSVSSQQQNQERNLVLLGHNWFTIRDELRDETFYADIWSVEQPKSLMHLFEYGITSPEDLSNTIFCFVHSMSRPWLILARLQTWRDALLAAVDKLKFDSGNTRANWQRAREQDFITLREQFAAASKTSSNATNAAASAPNAVSGAVLGPDVLSVNTGLNLFVVITKADYAAALEREYGWKDQHFDYLQLALRRWCLAHGASLIYTSSHSGKNIGLLINYISSRLISMYFSSGSVEQQQASETAAAAATGTTRRAVAAPTPAFQETAHIIEKDDVFIPLGWDSSKKIDVLRDSIQLASGGAAEHRAEVEADDDDDVGGMIDAQGLPNVQYFEQLFVPPQARHAYFQQKPYADSHLPDEATRSSATVKSQQQPSNQQQDDEQQFLNEMLQLLEIPTTGAAPGAAAASNNGAPIAGRAGGMVADGGGAVDSDLMTVNSNAAAANHHHDLLTTNLGGGGSRPLSAGMTPAKSTRGSAGMNSNMSSSAAPSSSAAAVQAALAPGGGAGGGGSSINASADKAVSLFFEEMLRKKPSQASSSSETTQATTTTTMNPAAQK